MKTLVISMHPAPYRDPVFVALKNKTDVDFLDLYGTDRGHTEWGYEHAKKTVKFRRIPFLGDFHFGLRKIVKEYDTVLIPGWFPIGLLDLLIFCVKQHKKVVFSCDTVSCSNNLFHKYIFKYLKKCNSFFVPGNRAALFLENQVGIEPKKIFRGSYMIDESDWSNKVNKWRNNRQANRESLKISETDFILLFGGKFVKNRDIPLLVNSIKLAREKNKNIRCIIIGTGEFYKDSILDCLKYDSNAIIHYEKVQYEELAKFYSVADCYIHPGDEPYSLATVQAVIAGLPIISHENVGCLSDYVVDGDNGLIIQEKDSSKFSDAIINIFENKDKFFNNANLACEHYLQERNVDYAVKQLIDALNH